MGSTAARRGSRANGNAALAERSDEELLVAYSRKNDRLSFETLVHRYERELYSYLRRYLGDAALAEDAFQATFLQLHLKCDQFEPQRKVRPWLYTIATNQAIDAQRRGKRHRMPSLDRQRCRDGEESVGSLMELLVGREDGPSQRIEAAEQRAWIQSAVAQLPDALKSALVLIYYQELKYREAAEVLSIPVGTVKSRLHTAILRLREVLRRDDSSGDA